MGQSVEVLWKWDDASATWKATPQFPAAIDPTAVGSLAVNPAMPSQIFLAFLATNTPGVYESQDAGTTWTDASSGLPAIGGWELLFDPSLPNRLYAWGVNLQALDIKP
jgi:hypothetical protein